VSVIVPLCCVLHFCGGCGLLFVPTIDTYPNPVREVYVRDVFTQMPIPSAKVECFVVPVSHKGPFETRPRSIKASERYDWNPTDGGDRLTVTRVGESRFALASRSMLGWWQCLWPLWSWATAGDWQYHGHATRIVASAPGYAPQMIQYEAGESSAAFKAMQGDQALIFDLKPFSATTQKVEPGRTEPGRQ
jgi:hypothetical protein